MGESETEDDNSSADATSDVEKELKRKERKRKQQTLEDLATQYLEESKRKKPMITVEKKVTRLMICQW